MCQPKNTKYPKQFKGRIKGVAKGGSQISFGNFALKAQQPNRVGSREIEAARRAISRSMKRAGRIWICVFPDVPVTSKPTEVRMGKGKGNVEEWFCRVKPGRILFEVDGVSEETAREALRLGAAKLSIVTKFIRRIVE
ncbi:50S ribosomal protein L16 [Candidatus Liberibacter africanus]|uniref:Large ribosomal subunit protein uL16 n=1 Tax=Candidatus Liberibacter africanus PTSAPSY TaxID=1277257 RepID=A0A0G3I5S9_LIBAF|nr:50S ribosomal protein L16 [Candidatus Liberibacter africanus]AKK19823.1 50S ribosomal protein L16 [Candidatus Liberibacter africanus PTSAPSY]QTP64366.1 50S ribosomal protein L16 [Candidatus Liberibacter africanus]